MREELDGEAVTMPASRSEVPKRRSSMPARLSVRPEKAVLTSSQAAKLLGVSSPNTVKNWLEGGFFPGAYQTHGGHWRFPREEVLAVKRRMLEVRQKNQRGDLAPECDDAGEPPRL